MFQNHHQQPSPFSTGFAPQNTMLGRGRITKFMVMETGTYNQQYRRPYHAVVTGSAVREMQEALNQSPQNRITESTLAGIASQIVQPTAAPEAPIMISHGWGERRMRFMMEYEYLHQLGTSTKEVITGSSEALGISQSGHLDPNMNFFINSISHVNNFTELTAMGNQEFARVSSTNHLLADQNYSTLNSPNKSMTIRPHDIFAAMQLSHVTNEAGYPISNGNVLTGAATKSRRSNAVPTSYLSNILQNYTAAAVEAQAFNTGEQEILDKARTLSREDMAQKDHFIAAIAQIRGMPVSDTFTIKDLMQLDPNLPNVTYARVMANTEKAVTHYAGQTASWESSDRETLVATILSNAVPSLMMDLALTKMAFKATNLTYGAQIMINIFNIDGFSNNDKSVAGNAFISALESRILRDISFNGQESFAIDMIIDLNGETRISLSLDGRSTIDYVTPSFCDALLTPVITQNHALATDLAGSLERLTGYLGASPNQSLFINDSVGF